MLGPLLALPTVHSFANYCEFLVKGGKPLIKGDLNKPRMQKTPRSSYITSKFRKNDCCWKKINVWPGTMATCSNKDKYRWRFMVIRKLIEPEEGGECVIHSVRTLRQTPSSWCRPLKSWISLSGIISTYVTALGDWRLNTITSCCADHTGTCKHQLFTADGRFLVSHGFNLATLI